MGEQKAKKLASAIHFLSAWKRPNDIAVLAKLQGHRGYWVETTVTYPPSGGKETHRDRRYVVREAAAEDLREIPPGPVTNDEPEELPSPAEPVPGVLPPIEPPQK